MSTTRRATWAFVALCALVQAFSPHRAQAQADRRLVWRTLTTEHFQIHYHEPLGLFARKLAARVEEIHRRLSQGLGLSLRQDVQVVLSDSDDAANGFATVLPYNTVHLRVVAPDDMSTLADYDDWLTLLFTHEHAHVLHLEQASGLPRLVMALFGRNYTPQGSLPGWFTEGLAVVEETAHTTAGRGRSPMVDMYLRMAALEDRLPGIDLLGFDGEPWPHGHVRYVYGQAFLQYIADRHGERALGQFIEEYGKRLVPYGLNRAMRRVTGNTFASWYAAFTSDLRQRAEAVRARVESEGRVEGVRLTHHGELTRSPRFVSENELVYSVADARHVPEIRRLSLEQPGRSQRVQRVPAVAHVSPVRGGDRLVYSSVEYHRGTYAFNELSEVSPHGRRRLTWGLRAREPDVSPDGKRVAYVTHGAGTSHLVVAELADIAGTRRIVVRSRRGEQVFTPRWSPDGQTLAYSAWNRGGYRDVWLLDVASGERTRITYDRAIDRGPVFSPDGKRLYFASDRSGISNVYAYDRESGALTQITNVVGGAFQPDISPDGRTLVYVGYGSTGFDLYALDLAQAGARPAEPPRELAPAPAEPEPLVQQSTSYRPYRTLLPRYYALSTDTGAHGQRLVLSTGGHDVVGFHTWSLEALQGLDELGERGVEVGYTYRKPRFPLLVRASLHDQVRRDLVVNGQRQYWDALAWSVTLGSNFAFPRALRTLSLRADYSVGMFEHTSRVPIVFDPNYPPPRFPATGLDTRTAVTLTHASAQRQAFDISRSYGHVASVSARLRDPYLGSRTRDQGLSWRLEQYVRFRFRESVLAAAYTGAFRTPSVLGGYPAQSMPLFDYITGTRGAPNDYARLRGFSERRGERLEVVQLEYRFLVSRINRGLQTLPLFARRVHAALFADAGDAFDGRFKLSRMGVGVGGELRLDWASEYGTGFTLRGGVAQGVTEGGVLQWYATMARPF